MTDRNNYLRVTQILAPFAGYGNIPKEVLDKAANRGTRAHGIINGILKGLGHWGVDADIEGYIASAEQFIPNIGKIYHHEERFYSDALELTGQCDLVAEIGGKLCLLDWKTSSKPNPTWEAQAGGYFELIENKDIETAVFVKLNKDGNEPDVFIYEDLYEAQGEFRALYNIYHRYFKNFKPEIFE